MPLCDECAAAVAAAIQAEREATRNWSGKAYLAREDILDGLRARLQLPETAF